MNIPYLFYATQIQIFSVLFGAEEHGTAITETEVTPRNSRINSRILYTFCLFSSAFYFQNMKQTEDTDLHPYPFPVFKPLSDFGEKLHLGWPSA